MAVDGWEVELEKAKKLKDIGINIQLVFSRAYKKFQVRMAREIRHELQNAIRNADQFGFEPVTKEWARKKRSKGWSETVWNASGELADKIEVAIEGRELKVGWTDEPHTATGQPLSAIAQALELGVADKDFPPRPLIQMVMESMKPKLLSTYKSILLVELQALR